MPAIYTILIINKSGGLMFDRDFLPGISKTNGNDTLRLASIWHSVNAISTQLSPMPNCLGIELLQADTFDLHCFQALTGIKFLAMTEPQTPDVANLLRYTIYDLYADYALKNPFYEVDQRIKCELFDNHLNYTITGLHRRWGHPV
ncbi:hypothetical protein WJX73_002137 [Symbiochloris irregularis]|uniref:Trafficking protein particle complex subunit n=1 Tax=Symbiochloris irregularis TaxID=706552 RepID=A0AAW1PBI7_9CHLO